MREEYDIKKLKGKRRGIMPEISMKENRGNVFYNLPKHRLPEEITETLLERQDFKLERIISTGQITPEDEWYDQTQDEWVVLLKGKAKLLFKNEEEIYLEPGNYVFISAHKKHRISWTDPNDVCVWLALHANKNNGPTRTRT